MPKKLIVPLDGSDLAEVVLSYVEQDVGRTGSELILISVREPNNTHSLNMLQGYLEKIAATIKVNAEKYQPSPGGQPVTIRCEVLNGNPAEEIIAFASKEADSRIMMATNGQSGFTRWAVGSVAEKVSRVINQPITLIRAKGGRPDVRARGFFSKVLAPLDGSRESEVTLPYVEEMARDLQAEVVLLQVFIPDGFIASQLRLMDPESLRAFTNNYMEKLAGNMQEKGLQAKSVVLEARGDVAKEINNYTAQNYIDLVVMSTHGRSGLRRWVLGSVTDEVLHEGNTPIMLVRPPQPEGK
jgi:nucleotide-binding universal stress UspA family protein